MAYVHTLHEIYFVGAVVELPTEEKSKCTMPNAFDGMTNCRVITDCTQLRIVTPRNGLVASSTFYKYKHFKLSEYLIGVAPNSAILFAGNGFPGSTSDKSITNESGIMSHFQTLQILSIQLPDIVVLSLIRF